MKKNLTLCFLIICSTNSFAQTITFNELLSKVNCKNFACFKDFIETKRFSYNKSDKNNNRELYLYLSNQGFLTSSNNDITTKNTSIFLLGDSYTLVGARTAVVSYYQSLLKQIKNAGFVSNKIENITNGVIVYYSSKQHPKISVAVQTDILEKEGSQWTSYDISVTKNL